MEWYHIYLFTRIDYIINCLQIFMTLSAAGLIILTCFLPFFYEEEALRPIAIKVAKYLVIIFFSSIGLQVAIPSQTEVAAIYLVPKIVNNESVQKIPESVAKLLEVKLNQWIEESIKEN